MSKVLYSRARVALFEMLLADNMDEHLEGCQWLAVDDVLACNCGAEIDAANVVSDIERLLREERRLLAVLENAGGDT